MRLELSPRSRGARGQRSLLAAAIAATLTLLPSWSAEAQQVVVVQGAEGRGDRHGPSWGLLGPGLAVFGGTYLASVVVAASSAHTGDKLLYIPLVGPWLDIGTRCPNGCSGDLGRKVLLGFDGVFQGIGAVAVLASFFIQDGRSYGGRSKAPTFIVAPATYGRGAPGLTVAGTF